VIRQEQLRGRHFVARPTERRPEVDAEHVARLGLGAKGRTELGLLGAVEVEECLGHRSARVALTREVHREPDVGIEVGGEPDRCRLAGSKREDLVEDRPNGRRHPLQTIEPARVVIRPTAWPLPVVRPDRDGDDVRLGDRGPVPSVRSHAIEQTGRLQRVVRGQILDHDRLTERLLGEAAQGR